MYTPCRWTVQKLAYNHAMYISVGGLTWKAILEHIKGENLSENNKHLSNQWADYLRMKHKAAYVMVVLGSDDIDQYHRTTFHSSGMKTTTHMKKIRRDANAEFDKIKKNIRKVLHFLKTHCPDATICYIKITLRHSWGLPASILAKWLDYHVVVRLQCEKNSRYRKFGTRPFSSTHRKSGHRQCMEC